MASSATRLGVVAILVLLIVGAGIGVYFLFFNNSKPPPPPPSPPPPTPKPPPELFPWVMLVNTGDGAIMQVDLNSGADKLLVESPVFGITTFDYYKKKNTLFYATTELGHPILFDGNGQQVELSLSRGWTKTAVAVDFITDKIYAIDSLDSKLWVLDLQNKFHRELLTNLEDPKGLILEPYLGIMFILQSSSVVQANMDGSNVTKIINVEDLQTMDIDYKRKVIYYANSSELNSYNYAEKKTGKLHVKVSYDRSIVTLSTARDQIYLTASQNDPLPDMLMTCQIKNDTCQLSPFPHLNLSFMQSIKVYDRKEAEIPFKNPCEVNNGNCQQLCLLSSKDSKYSCACQQGWKLKNDLKACEKN